MGAGLGGMAKWHGDFAIHLLSTGGWPRVPTRHCEITYGLERLAMYLQDVESIFDITWTDGPLGRISYADVHHQNEVEQSRYNFEEADVEALFASFDQAEKESLRLIEVDLALPAYEQMLSASHTFNLLDARQAISVSERQRFILRVRTMARGIAETYYKSRETLASQ